ncbi:MAG: hypothetical protein HOW73_43085, partial [Polyangiaceae bacterium]|nr:hypothetical protein [Polyangiaceae bacterium]
PRATEALGPEPTASTTTGSGPESTIPQLTASLPVAPDEPGAGARASAAQACAKRALDALDKKDASGLAALAHPERGIRFTPFGIVDSKRDVVLHTAELKRAFSDPTVRTWGHMGESDQRIRMTFSQYRDRFLYDRDYAKLRAAQPDTTDTFEGRIWNVAAIRDALREAYADGTGSEYRSPPPKGDDLDWRVLRVICAPHDGNHYVVGIISNEWTP